MYTNCIKTVVPATITTPGEAQRNKMATAQTIDQLATEIKNLESIDKQKLFRPNLGDESLQSEIEPILVQFLDKAQHAIEYASLVADDQVRSLTGLFQAFYQTLNSQAELDPSGYIQNKNNLLNELIGQREEMLQWWPPFVTAAVEAKGFLKDEGILKEHDKAIGNLKTQAQAAIASIDEESQKILAEAKKVANEIEQRARRTAARVSVDEAQKQFKEAQKHHEGQVKLWAWISGGSGTIFLGGVFFLLWFVEPDSSGGWQPLYYTALRLALLGVLGAFTAFCLRTFRAHLHMRELNLHRQRVANSIPSFVDSAVNHDQRDLILAQLIDAVATFGNSGLLRDDLATPTKLAVDSVLRNINAPTQS